MLNDITRWVGDNWIAIIAAIMAFQEFLRLIDKLLPDSVKIDNHIADYIAKILKFLGQKKTVE